MTDSITMATSADIVPAVVDRIRAAIGWLERRRDNELYTNSAGDIEITAEEMDKLITGLKGWVEALELVAKN
jgi:hypothetical protein